MNLRALIKYQGKSLNLISITIKPIFATAIMTVVAHYAYKLSFIYTMKNSWSTLISIFIAVIIYGILIIIIGGLKAEELEMAPGGQKLSRLLKKKGLL